MLNFPEGTTSDGLTVPPLPPRRVRLRRGSRRVPIVPVRIDYDDDTRVAWTGDATFVPHYLALLSRGPVRARVTFGTPIAARRDRTARELAEEARAR